MDYITEAVKTGIKVGVKVGTTVELHMWDYEASAWVMHSTHSTVSLAVKAAEQILKGNF